MANRQLALYPPEELRERFKALAERERRTEAQMVLILAEEGLAAREKEVAGVSDR